MKDFLGKELKKDQDIIVCIEKNAQGRGFGTGTVVGFTKEFVRVICTSRWWNDQTTERLLAPHFVIGISE